MRIGIGYDIHCLVPERQLVLGGVSIPHDRGLDGHSDADVLAHAICDALLGAAALGDIGTHFPDSDPAYKDISSMLLLRKTGTIIEQAGWRIVNIDSTVIAEVPKLSPYRFPMRDHIAAALVIDPATVSVKASTAEGLGPIGNGDAIAANAVALLDAGIREKG